MNGIGFLAEQFLHFKDFNLYFLSLFDYSYYGNDVINAYFWISSLTTFKRYGVNATSFIDNREDRWTSSKLDMRYFASDFNHFAEVFIKLCNLHQWNFFANLYYLVVVHFLGNKIDFASWSYVYDLNEHNVIFFQFFVVEVFLVN